VQYTEIDIKYKSQISHLSSTSSASRVMIGVFLLLVTFAFSLAFAVEPFLAPFPVPLALPFLFPLAS